MSAEWSDAEWEYAYQFRDYLETGEPKPDPTGFDPQRIRIIEDALNNAWNDQLRIIRGSKRK